ncbi:hypothetical protein ACMD2_15379 [Ananas comosus]|uniref:Uncharacterized protein n=1 Tax=Ananas comosus TaxID=4615 RepID=A0A199UNH5_ANACO|nr:hypothetical protein ACMD2_15379 [Ananas comosus]
MATVTPGVLLKLLQSMDTEARVAGEHRSAVLQVTGIVPALSASTADDLWPAHGFYLQLSDSLHSTYVALSDRDADAVLSARPQLGQLVHVDRLRFDRPPVPRALGLRPVPASRPSPSPAPRAPPRLPRPRRPPLLPSSSSSRKSPNFPLEPDNSISDKENAAAAAPNGKRRFSSPAGAKLAARKSNGESSRPSSPSVGSRPSSPAPSKCVVPSLVAAKEENRRAAREPAIVVPSRYRNPSPAGRKSASSPMGRRGSMSPARRLSGGLKMSPATGEKKKGGVVVAGISKVSDALLGSVKSMRKSWDDSSVSSELKDKGGSKSKVDKEAILRTQVAMSRRLSDASWEQSNNEEASTNEKPKPSKKVEPEVSKYEKTKSSKKMESASSEKQNLASANVTVQERKWTDGSIPLDGVSSNLAKLGKDAFLRRDIASVAAAEALEEALVTESVIRNLSMFSNLCSTSKANNPLPTIDRFLSIYEDIVKLNSTSESLNNGPNDTTSLESTKSATLWVEAALVTDLEALRLLNDVTECIHKQKDIEKPKAVSVDPPRTSLSKRQPSSIANKWRRGQGMSETLELAKALRHEMQNWFLKFVEEALDVGFRLFGDGSSNGKDNNGRVAAVLSQLKRINEWLDGVGRVQGEDRVKERVEQLKRKIYGFVISHVGSAFDSSVSLSNSFSQTKKP